MHHYLQASLCPTIGSHGSNRTLCVEVSAVKILDASHCFRSSSRSRSCPSQRHPQRTPLQLGSRQLVHTRSGYSSTESFELQKHACLLMYRLFDWYQLGEELKSAGGPGRNPVDQSICLAYLIFLVFATEPHAQSFGSRLSKTVTKLRQALEVIMVEQWTNVPDLLLWTLTMGAMGAKGLPRPQQSSASEYGFFVQYFHLTFVSKGHDSSTTAGSLLRRLQHCPWISSIFDTRARRMWAQVGLCRADLTNVYDSSSEEEEASVGDEHAVGQSTTARFFPALKSASKKSSPR